MNKQEAIKWLEQMLPTFKEGSQEWEVTTMAIEAINRVEELEKLFAEMLEQAKSESKDDDWIPVSDDTLPDEDVDVNVTLKDFAETRTGFLADEGWWLITKEGMLESYPLGYVVAWQPLPEPYKESDTE